MKIKQMLLSVVCLLVAVSAYTEDNWLHIRTASGWQVLSLDQVDRLTFTGGQMTATDASGAVVATIPQNTIETISVKETTGISTVADASAKASFKLSGDGAVITALADGDFEIYNAAGMLMESISGVKAGETIDLGKLPAGVLIVKLGAYSQKVVLK